MSILDWLQLVLVGLALAGWLFARVNRWAVETHRDRLAMVTSAAGNAAGRIRESLNGLPPSTDAAAVKRALMAVATRELLEEFDRTAPKIQATSAKIEAMIEGQLGKIPVLPGAPVVQTTLDAAMEAVAGAAGVPRTAGGVLLRGLSQ